jgi:hypothetical protein
MRKKNDPSRKNKKTVGIHFWRSEMEPRRRLPLLPALVAWRNFHRVRKKKTEDDTTSAMLM